MWQMKDNKALT